MFMPFENSNERIVPLRKRSPIVVSIAQRKEKRDSKLIMKIAENKQKQIKLLKTSSNRSPNLFKLASK